MSLHPTPEIFPNDLDALAGHEGRIALFADIDTPLPQATRRADRLTRRGAWHALWPVPISPS